MELLSRCARCRKIQRVYLHGPGHHNHSRHPDPARKHDMDRSSRRCTYTSRPLHFRAETESEADGERKYYGCLTASIFYFVIRLPPINERDLIKEESKWLMKWS